MPSRKGKAKGVAKGGIKKPRYPGTAPNPKNFGIGNNVQPSRDVTRFVRWPKYVRLQRQKRVLLKRLKIPPAVNQFTNALDAHSAKVLFDFLERYKPETKKQKKDRLKNAAKEEKKEGESKPVVLKYGLNHVAALIEDKAAKLVVIAHDVDPVELVLWIPTACRKKEIPYLIVKGKARLGKLVHKKTAAVVAITGVNPKDDSEFDLLRQKAVDQYLNRYSEIMSTRGGGIMGYKHNCKEAKKIRAIEKDKARIK